MFTFMSAVEANCKCVKNITAESFLSQPGKQQQHKLGREHNRSMIKIITTKIFRRNLQSLYAEILFTEYVPLLRNINLIILQTQYNFSTIRMNLSTKFDLNMYEVKNIQLDNNAFGIIINDQRYTLFHIYQLMILKA